MKMKAAVCNEIGKPLDIEEVEVIDPRPGEVLVKVDATAVCHSDLHVIEPGFPTRLPGIPGHETAGHVVKVGEGVNRIKVGDVVSCTTTTVGCGFCDNCLAGNRTACTTHPAMGGPGMMREPGIHNRKGQPLATMAGTVGGFAEYVLVREYQLVKIAADMPIDRACILSCAVATGFGSSIVAGVRPFSSALVIGTGGVGYNAIQGSAFLGACPVIAMDILENRLEAARKFGATHLINSSKVDPKQAVMEITEGKGADFVFVTVGRSNHNLVKQAIEMSSAKGVTVQIAFGEMTPEAMKNTEWMQPLVGGMSSFRRVISTYIGGSNIIQDIPNYVRLYKAGRLNLDDLVSGHYPLDKINDAIAKLRTGEAIRSIIMM